MSSLTSTEVNGLIWRYLTEAGFTHSAYTFGNESQVTKMYPEMAQLAPGSLVRFLYKGVQFVEIEANLKEDKSSVEEIYKLVNARDMITMDTKEVRDHVQAMRAEEEESSDQEPAAAPQPARQTSEARLGKAKRGRKTANGLQHSPVRASAATEEPAQPSQRSSEREQQAQQQAQQPQQAQPSSHTSQQQAAEMQAAKPTRVAQPPKAQVTVLDTQYRETRMCMWSPTEAVLASGLGDSEALLWRQPASSAAPSAAFTSTVLPHNQPESDKSCAVECLDWNASGTVLATGSMDGLVRLWEPSGQQKSCLRGHKSAVTCLKFSRTADILLSGSVDKTAIIWTEGVQTSVVTQHTSSVCCVAWKNDHYFATASADHVIFIHHGDQAPSAPLRGSDLDLTHLSWSPDGAHLVSGSEGGVVVVWSPDQGTLLHTLREHSADITAMVWCPQASLPQQQHLLATASQDHSIRLWDVAAGTCVRELKFASKIRSVAFQADGAYMIAGGDDGDVSVWSVADAKQLLNVPCHGSISSVTCNSRRNVVAAASSRSKQIYIITILMT